MGEFPTDLAIARQATLKPLPDVAAEMGPMPGLASHPAAEHIDIDKAGEIVGLS